MTAARALSTALGIALAAAIAGRAFAAGGGAIEPPARLSETGLFAGGDPDRIAPANRPFAPQYPLWTDGAAKRRWVYLPPGAAIDAADPYEWDFPTGTRFWKEFSFGGRKVETRLLWKTGADRWIAVSYLWNEEQTDATLAPERGAPNAAEIAPGKGHSVPARTDCLACHGEERTGPLGFTALQLSPNRDPLAVHGEPLGPDMITLRTLLDERRIASDDEGERLAPAPRIAARRPETRAVLGYLLANCGSCHNGRGEISAVAPVLRARDLVTDGDAVAKRFVGHATKWQGPGRTEGTLLIDPAAPDASALLLRMRSRRPSSQMPPMGTVVRDDAAVAVVTEWVAATLLPSHGR